MIDGMKEWLGAHWVPVLKWLLDPWHTLLAGLPPWVWRSAVCSFLILGTVWVMFLRREEVYAGAPSQARWRDLRWWIPLLLVPYVWVYLVF